MASITAPGVGSGLDIASLVSQLVAAEGQGKSIRLARREAFAQAEISALGSLKSALSSFQSAVQDLDALSDFRKRSASSADEDLFTASADDKAVAGSYSIEVVNLAAAHKLASTGYTDSNAHRLVELNGTVSQSNQNKLGGLLRARGFERDEHPRRINGCRARCWHTGTP